MELFKLCLLCGVIYMALAPLVNGNVIEIPHRTDIECLQSINSVSQTGSPQDTTRVQPTSNATSSGLLTTAFATTTSAASTTLTTTAITTASSTTTTTTPTTISTTTSSTTTPTAATTETTTTTPTTISTSMSTSPRATTRVARTRATNRPRQNNRRPPLRSRRPSTATVSCGRYCQYNRKTFLFYGRCYSFRRPVTCLFCRYDFKCGRGTQVYL